MRLGSSALCIWDRHPGLVGFGRLYIQNHTNQSVSRALSCTIMLGHHAWWVVLECWEDSNTEQGPQWDCHEHHIGSCFHPSLDVGCSDGLLRGDLWPLPRSAEDGAIGPRKPGSTANLAKRWGGSECILQKHTDAELAKQQPALSRVLPCTFLACCSCWFHKPRAIQNHQIYSCPKASCFPCNLVQACSSVNMSPLILPYSFFTLRWFIKTNLLSARV